MNYIGCSVDERLSSIDHFDLEMIYLLMTEYMSKNVVIFEDTSRMILTPIS